MLNMLNMEYDRSMTENTSLELFRIYAAFKEWIIECGKRMLLEMKRCLRTKPVDAITKEI